MSESNKLTAQQILDKFQFKKPNENCLHDMACPKCGRRSEFLIQVSTLAAINDDGGNGTDGDLEWDEKSHIRCQNTKCFFSGTVADFTFEGLDDLIENNETD